MAVCGLVGGAGATTLAYLLARRAARHSSAPVLLAELQHQRRPGRPGRREQPARPARARPRRRRATRRSSAPFAELDGGLRLVACRPAAPSREPAPAAALGRVLARRARRTRPGRRRRRPARAGPRQTPLLRGRQPRAVRAARHRGGAAARRAARRRRRLRPRPPAAQPRWWPSPPSPAAARPVKQLRRLAERHTDRLLLVPHIPELAAGRLDRADGQLEATFAALATILRRQPVSAARPLPRLAGRVALAALACSGAARPAGLGARRRPPGARSCSAFSFAGPARDPAARSRSPPPTCASPAPRCSPPAPCARRPQLRLALDATLGAAGWRSTSPPLGAALAAYGARLLEGRGPARAARARRLRARRRRLPRRPRRPARQPAHLARRRGAALALLAGRRRARNLRPDSEAADDRPHAFLAALPARAGRVRRRWPCPPTRYVATHDLGRTVREFTAGKPVTWPPAPKPGAQRRHRRTSPTELVEPARRTAARSRRWRCSRSARCCSLVARPLSAAGVPASWPPTSCASAATTSPTRSACRRPSRASSAPSRRAGTSGSGAARTTSRSRPTGCPTSSIRFTLAAPARLVAAIAGPLEDLYPDVRLIEQPGRPAWAGRRDAAQEAPLLRALAADHAQLRARLHRIAGRAARQPRGQHHRAARAHPGARRSCTAARGGCSSAANAASTRATAATRSTPAWTPSSRPKSSRGRSRPSTARSATSTCASPARTPPRCAAWPACSASCAPRTSSSAATCACAARLYARRVELALPNPLPGLRAGHPLDLRAGHPLAAPARAGQARPHPARRDAARRRAAGDLPRPRARADARRARPRRASPPPTASTGTP